MPTPLAVKKLLLVRALASLLSCAPLLPAAAGAQDSTGVAIAAGSPVAAAPESLAAAALVAPGPVLPTPAPGFLDRVLPGGMQAPASAPDVAEVAVANRPIIRFHATIMGYSPQLRAEAADRQIQGLLARGVFGPVTTRPTPEGVLFELGGTPIFRILHGDVDVSVGETLPGLRDATQARLEVALAEVREGRNLPRLLRALARAALATLVVVALAFLIRRPLAWARRRLETFAAARVQPVKASGLPTPGLDQIAILIRWLLLIVKWAVLLILAYGWLTFVLHQFPYTRLWGEILGSQLAALFARVVRAAVAALPGLAVVTLIFLVARWAQRVLNVYCDSVARGGPRSRPCIPTPYRPAGGSPRSCSGSSRSPSRIRTFPARRAPPSRVCR